MDTILQDLRFALRQLRKNPGFTAIAVLTLALGIAVNATMFSMVSAILLRRPPGIEPERVAVVTSIDPASGFQADATQVSAPNFLAWRESNHVFSEMAAADLYRTASLTSQRDSQSVRAAAVSANFFRVLGVSTELGRTFTVGEDQAGQDHVVILSHQLWEQNFGSDPSIIGHTVRINRETYTVIGIMPGNFRLLGFASQLWMPLVFSPSDRSAAAHSERSFYLFGRMKPGATIQQAKSEFATLAQRSQSAFPETEKGWGATARTLPDFLIYTFGIRAGLAVIMTTVGFVLLIACANVSGLLLARAVSRKKEIAIRASMGAGRLRIVRQLLTEGLIIALLGGSAGVVFSYWGIRFVRDSLSSNLAIAALDLHLDTNVLLFSMGVSILCAMLCSLAPALRASRADVTESLKDESRTASAGRSHARLRTVMVSGEISLALCLLIGTGLLFVGIFRIEHQNLGFQPQHLLTAGITLDEARFKDSDHRIAFVHDLITKLHEIPGASSVAVTSDLPASGPGRVTLHIQGQPEPAANQSPSAFDSVVSPEYFRTASIALLYGRVFTDMDKAHSPRVILVNQKFVDQFFHDADPLGKRLRLEVKESSSDWSEIIGVVGNVKTFSEIATDSPEVYEPFLQRPVPAFSMMVQTTADPGTLGSAARAAVAQLDPDLPLANLMTMTAVLDRQNAGDHFFARILGSFAVLALLLAGIGIYGLMAFTVGQRTHEIGIRMAVGARNHDILRMIFRQGMKMALVGGAIGLALSIPLPRIFDAIFFDFHIREPRLYFVVPVLIFLVTIVAAYVPALRAARVDPMKALRQE
ncbi:MAG TPA: ABC transporter permease [Candidatus Sulfotelmatobacter sp.]|nr:ABC transporter permease [Candidatus Sulfotelmatobacter sp.]